MFKWLLSRPLQIKFFCSSILLVSAAMLMIMLNVFQVLNQFLSKQIEDDLQQRTHILAMTLMVGPAAHDRDELLHLLQDVTVMHGYCYLSVQNSAGKVLASAGNVAAKRPPVPDIALTDDDHNSCFDGAIPLEHDGKPFGTLHYGVDTSFVSSLEYKLQSKLLLVAALWFAIGTGVYFFLVRRLVKPLKEITRASESMAQGNLNTPMPKELPQDELGKLALSFSNMATSLRERIESQQSYAHALYVEQARLNALISILPFGIMFVDTARQVQFINQECRRLWGLSESEDYINMRDTELIAQATRMTLQPDALQQQLDAALKEYGVTPAFDTPLRSGKIIRSRSFVVPDAAGDRYIGRIWMYEDVTVEHARLREAQERAERDALTGLHNRRRFEEDLERSFAQAQRSGSRLSLLYFNLDDFKGINDTHGHATGDKIVKSVAQALMLQARRNENLYHVGGDQFAIMSTDSEQRQIETMAQRVIATVGQVRLNVSDFQIHISCSVGIAICAQGERPNNAEGLLRQAELAMYQAKHIGKNRWQLYDPALTLDLGKDSR